MGYTRTSVDSLKLDSKINLLRQTYDKTTTSLIAPKGKRLWHIHPSNKNHKGQNEIWTTNQTLLLGLIDFRKSPELSFDFLEPELM